MHDQLQQTWSPCTPTHIQTYTFQSHPFVPKGPDLAIAAEQQGVPLCCCHCTHGLTLQDRCDQSAGSLHTCFTGGQITRAEGAYRRVQRTCFAASVCGNCMHVQAKVSCICSQCPYASNCTGKTQTTSHLQCIDDTPPSMHLQQATFNASTTSHLQCIDDTRA